MASHNHDHNVTLTECLAKHCLTKELKSFASVIFRRGMHSIADVYLRIKKLIMNMGSVDGRVNRMFAHTRLSLSIYLCVKQSTCKWHHSNEINCENTQWNVKTKKYECTYAIHLLLASDAVAVLFFVFFLRDALVMCQWPFWIVKKFKCVLLPLHH